MNMISFYGFQESLRLKYFLDSASYQVKPPWRNWLDPLFNARGPLQRDAMPRSHLFVTKKTQHGQSKPLICSMGKLKLFKAKEPS